MIKKLKIKFIVTIMMIVFVLLSAMLSFVYISTKHTLENESGEALEWYLAQDPSMVFNDRFDTFFSGKQKYSHYSVFIFDYNYLLRTVTPYGFDKEITEDEKEYIFSLMNTVLERKAYSGILKDRELKYLASDLRNGVRIAFLDMRYEDQTLSKLFWLLLLIGIAGLICFFFITLLIAAKAFRPLEKSWKQQKQLIADVSHELKTPLAVISANTSIIESHHDSTVSEESKWIGFIKDETDKMNELIARLLYLAKSDETQSEIEKESFDLSSVIMASLLPFESVCFEKGLMLEYDIQPDVPFCGNKELISRLVSILTDNACKYSHPATQITVELRTAADKVMFSVNSKGDLLSSETLKHIFERFYRSDPSRASSGSSFGLGLSIAKTIVESHDGKINAHSDVENGNTFVCVFKKS